MYFSPKKHLLSETILGVALIRLAGAGISGILRVLMRRASAQPDMADGAIWKMQVAVGGLTILFSAYVFIHAIRLIDKKLKLIPVEDRQEMARLQEETFGTGNAALSAETIRRLLQIWLVILVGARFMYECSSNVYRRFAADLAELAASAQGGPAGAIYISLYNLTHGFKYQGMLIALLLGAMMTAIFLNDRTLKIASIIIAGLFMISTAGVEMSTLSLLGEEYGIVWSSVIFHLMETVGLVGLAIYLRKKYHGI